MRKIGSIAALALSALLALSSCSSEAETPAVEDAPPVGGEILTEHGLAEKDVRTLITELDQLPKAERPVNLIASIRPTELLLADDLGREELVPMPEDEFYVSFAPYVNQTHPCHFHSLTTCTGELGNTEIALTVTNDTSGETVWDETVTTYDNGFYGIWLPKDIDATLTVEYDGKVATTQISTAGDEDATCVTEPLQLR